MKIKRTDIEIMAPVGSYESLAAAAQSGANSVYFGVEQLNMRSGSAANFTLDDLRRIATFCNENSLKSYLTVNCILYDEDIEMMKKVVDCAKEAKINAVIVSDQAAIEYARSVGVEVHISTQLNVSNYETLKFYARYADVVVLARELNMDQVKAIYNRIEQEKLCGPAGEPIKIEMFVHGALCMAVSGKCYLSLHEADKSANRGACRQICRRSYDVRDRETGAELTVDNKYIMSPQDLCTVDFLDKVLESGVRVLKIEGRARGAEYVKRVCECYNEAIEAIVEERYTRELANGLKERLRTVFNRGFWDGYYLGRRLGEWSKSYGSSAIRKKEYVGRVTNYFKNIGVTEIRIEASTIELGDDLLFIGDTTGVVELKLEEVRVDLKPTDKVSQGILCSIATPLVRRGDKLYKWVENKK